MDWLIETILLYPRRATAGIGVFVLLCAGLAWWLLAWQSPQHAFEDMLSNNLTATSVTRTAIAGSGQQNVEQDVRLQMGATNATDWLVSVTQTGAEVTTESISTPDTGYIRYVAIRTAQMNKKGQPFDFSPALNQWGKSDGKTDQSLNSLFGQTLFDISSAPTPPIGNLPASERENILAYNRDEQVFTTDYSKAKRETVNGRGVYTYSVSVKLGAYIRMMQAFAHDLGFHNLDTVDPSQYSTLPPIVITVSVDRASHQLARVAYSASGFSQTYSDWGLAMPITVPHATLTTTELQSKITALAAK